MGAKSTRITACCVLLLVTLHGIGTAAQDDDTKSASAVVQRLHDTLLEVMQEASTLGFEGRRERLAPVVSDAFDVPFIARVSLGRHWRKLDDEQRSAAIETLRRLTAATYAARFNGYDGEQFRTVSAAPVEGRRMRVDTVLEPGSGEAVVRLDYVLQPDGGHWRIVNILADGVSDLSLRRAQYGALVTDKGFDALISALEREIDGYAKTN